MENLIMEIMAKKQAILNIGSSSSKRKAADSSSDGEFVLKKRRVSERPQYWDSSESSSETDDNSLIGRGLKRKRFSVLASSDSDSDEEPVLKRTRSENLGDAATSPLFVDAATSPRHPTISPPFVAASPHRATPSPPPAARRRGRPRKKQCNRPRDRLVRFLPDPTRVKPTVTRKRRTELELLLAHPR